jgi:hypothetical protein
VRQRREWNPAKNRQGERTDIQENFPECEKEETDISVKDNCPERGKGERTNFRENLPGSSQGQSRDGIAKRTGLGLKKQGQHPYLF